MKVAIIQFPGSNCDQDALWSMRNDLGLQADYVWQDETSLAGFEAVFIPGGFTFGDYLRCGAVAANAPIMAEVRRLADRGNPVIGVCNGFQTLCEAQLLPGALLRNEKERFICHDVWLKASNRSSIWTESIDRPLRIPIAHGEGRYICDADTLKSLEDGDSIAFHYCNQAGVVTEESNPNGSINNIAGVLNGQKNVLGMMPHPERATSAILGGTDGLAILSALKSVNAV